MGKGKSSVDTQSYSPSIQLDEYGNIVKKTAQRKNSVDIIIKEKDDYETPPPPIVHKPVLVKQAEVDRPQISPATVPAQQQIQQFQQEPAQQQTQYQQPPQFQQQQFQQPQQPQEQQQAAAYTNMAQNYISNQQQQQLLYQQMFQRYHQQIFAQQYQQQQQQHFQQQQQQQPVYQPPYQQQMMQQQFQQQPNYKLPNYSMPPSIYNQPEVVATPPPPQQFQQFVSHTIRQNDNIGSKSPTNSDGLSSSSSSNLSVNGAVSPVGGVNTPFGTKLSLKKPKQREPVKRQLTDREKLLEEINNVGPYQAGMVRQISTSSTNSVFTRSESATSQGSVTAFPKLRPASARQLGPKLSEDEPSQRDLLFQEIKQAASVSSHHIHDGHQNQAAPVAPPPPPAAPLLRPASERRINQRPVQQELSLNDQLMAQIRKSASVSDEYVFDGSNQEKKVENTGVVKSSIGSASVAPKSGQLEGRDLLLSEIQNGLKLRPVPN